MIPLHSAGDITFGRFEPSDLREMAVLLAGTFSAGEPMAVAVGLKGPEIERMVTRYGPKAAAEGLTVVARTSRGEMVGALLTDDFGEPAPEGLEEAAGEAFRPIGALLEGLDRAYGAGKTIRPGSHAHLFMLGVAPAFGGRKVAQGLVEVCLAHALRQGYTAAVTEATGTVSQHIFRKLGFVERLTARYADFRFEGRPVFASIAGPGRTILMDKALA